MIKIGSYPSFKSRTYSTANHRTIRKDTYNDLKLLLKAARKWRKRDFSYGNGVAWDKELDEATERLYRVKL